MPAKAMVAAVQAMPATIPYRAAAVITPTMARLAPAPVWTAAIRAVAIAAPAAVAGDAVFADQLRQAESAAKLKGQSGDEAKLKRVCQEMESVFLNMLLTTMRASVPKTGLTGEDSQGEEIMQSMLDQELSKNMSQAGGIGLADMMYRQLSMTNSASVKASSQSSR